MMKYVLALILLLNVTYYPAIADCVTGFACTLKDINKENTNSVKEQQGKDLKKDEIIKQQNISTEKFEKDEFNNERQIQEKNK